jgi:predicted nucleotide-binding protein
MPKYPKEEKILPSLQSNQSIELLQKQIEQIDKLSQLHHDDPKIDRWENFTEQIIIKAFGKPNENLSAYLDEKYTGEWYTDMPDEALQENFIKKLQKRKSLLEGFIEQLKAFSGIGESQAVAVPKNLSSKKVFIVHGHNEHAKTELTLILTQLGFEPIILHEQPSQGMTVIEKLEKHSDVGFAFVLLTPDDKGCQKGQEDNLLPRARQNVVFEFGLFVGKLGRNRVCCLYTGDVELPSDLQGLVYLPFKSSINEVRLDIVKELRAAGYEVKI